jgi:dipeptidyl aminopeptidase/acylaminoacyl peptidase
MRMANYRAFRAAVFFSTSLFAGFVSAEPPGVEFFAAHNKIQNVVISPDGEHIAFNYEEEHNEVKLAIAKSDLSEIVHVVGYGKDTLMGGHFWANNTRIVTNQSRNTGFLDGRSQLSQLLALDYNGKNRTELFVPQRSGINILSRLRQDPENILVGKSHFSDEGQISLNKLNVESGDMDYLGPLPMDSSETTIRGLAVDLDGDLRIAIEVDSGSDEFDDVDDVISFHYKSESGNWKKLKLGQKRSPGRFQPLGFSSDNRHYYFLSNYDVAENDASKRDTMGVFSFDFEDKELILEYRHPDVDVLGAIEGPVGEVIGVRYEPGYPENYYFNSENPHVKLLQAFQATFPNEEVSIPNYTDDGESCVVFVRGDRNPGMYYIYKEGRLKHVASTQPEIDSDWLGGSEAFTMQSRDGVKLYGFLTLPPGGKDTNLPLIVNPHGGPHGPFDRWGYDRRVQMLASNGYAVLQVNFRGSGGYGEDFEKSGYQKWGREMQDDVTDATRWAIKEGIADPERICIYGGSYGGYATLQALVREPDLYKCGIGVAGVYSLPMMWKKFDGMRLGSRKFTKVFLTNVLGTDEATLKAYSPAFNVDKIKAAVFIIHGSEDVRVPIDQAELLAENLKKAGIPYEWMVRAEGHGFSDEKNRRDQFEAMLAFFKKHIGRNELAAN